VRPCARDRDADPLHCVVRVAADVPGGLEGLHVSRRVPRARAENELAGTSVPFQAPCTPGPAPETISLDLGVRPGLAVVGRDLDARDVGNSRPRTPAQLAAAGRSGQPCCGGTGTPLTSYARIASPPSSSSRATLRAYSCSSSPSTPRSRPVKTTSTASFSTPASARRSPTGVPRQRAVPTASTIQGWLTT